MVQFFQYHVPFVPSKDPGHRRFSSVICLRDMCKSQGPQLCKCMDARLTLNLPSRKHKEPRDSKRSRSSLCKVAAAKPPFARRSCSTAQHSATPQPRISTQSQQQSPHQTLGGVAYVLSGRGLSKPSDFTSSTEEAFVRRDHACRGGISR